MIVFFSSYNLKMNNPKKIYEINVSTREPNTRQICAGSYEYSLSEYINFPEWANTYVGVRDVQPPGVLATLTCSVNMFHILEKYDKQGRIHGNMCRGRLGRGRNAYLHAKS